MDDNHVAEFKELNDLGVEVPDDIARNRGTKFEKLINEIFKSEKILVRSSYHTSDNRSEQIDSAIEVYHRIFLIEVKWVRSNLAASELFSFIGKTDNKFQGTLGVFISRHELTDNFLDALCRGRRQSVIVIHGEDIDLFFKHKLEFEKYIEFAYKQLAHNNIVHFPVKKYIKVIGSETELREDTKPNAIAFIKKNILNVAVDEASLVLEMMSQSASEQMETLSLLIINYSKFWYNSYLKGNVNVINNVDLYISNFSISDRVEVVNISDNYYSNLLFSNLDVYGRESLVAFFSKFYTKITSESKVKFENALIEYWKKNHGQFEIENQLTRITQPIWNILKSEIISDLKQFYIEIYISDRREKFIQKQFSNFLFKNGEISEVEIKTWVKSMIRKDFEYYREAKRQDAIAESYIKLAKYLNLDLESWKKLIDEILESLKAS